MIFFAKKTDTPPLPSTVPSPLPSKVEENRFEQIRKAAADGHQKPDTAGKRRRDRQTVENNKLL